MAEGILHRLMTETWPAKAAQSALAALMAPGRAYQSTEPVTTEQMVAPAADLAGLLFSGGPAGAQAGAVGIFGGRLAKTADHAALARAEDMAAKGAPREQIWKETGWFQGADGKWRFEIDDSKAAVHQDVRQKFDAANVGDHVLLHNSDRVLSHPELFEAYPGLWATNITLEKGGGYPYQPHGSFSIRESGAQNIGINAATAPQAETLMLHELQHAIQKREGWPFGADFNAVGRDQYQRHAGEVEARNAERRRFMSPEERAAKPPWETQDYPYEQQVGLLDLMLGR